MALHLMKLAVGCDSIKDLQDFLRERMRKAKEQGLPRKHIHITRMTPKRDEELLDGGSLYWVIKGQIAAREKLLAIEPFRDKAGISRCRIVMEPKVITVTPRPMRAFQGWRYLSASDAPADLGKAGGKGLAAMPEPLRRELRELGLL
jgi:hypothetical protein